MDDRRLRLPVMPRMRWLAAWLVIALMGATPLAGAEEPITPQSVSSPETWGSAKHVTRLRHLYFADQPDEAGLERARDVGVVAVIDLRAPDETDFDEKSAVESLGMEYYNVPVSGGHFDPVAFERIEGLVERADGKPVLIHCSSSNRVGGWLATHLVTRHGMDIDSALAVGRKAGITKPVIEKSARDYVDQQAKE